MSTLSDDLIRSLKEALAHAKGNGPGKVHGPETPQGLGNSNAPVDAVGAGDQIDFSPVDLRER